MPSGIPRDLPLYIHRSHPTNIRSPLNLQGSVLPNLCIDRLQRERERENEKNFSLRIEVQQVGKFMRKEIKKREYAIRNDYYCRLMRSKDRILDF